MDNEERAILTKFFEELLLENGGAYTLLGSKAATVEDLIDMSPKNRRKLQEYLAAHPEIETIEIDRHIEEGWGILKKRPAPTTGRFILTEVNCGDFNQLTFINTDLAIQLMKKYYTEFRRAAGFDFDPTIAIEYLRIGKHDMWRRIFNDFTCLGILLGYGAENSRLFEKFYDQRKNRDKSDSFAASENNDPRVKAECYLNDKPFRLPHFVMFDLKESEDLIAQYRQEREDIKSFYSGKDFLDATLEQLEQVQSPELTRNLD